MIHEGQSLTVVDVGAGRTCHFDPGPKGKHVSRIVGIDISREEMAHNPLLDDRVVADVCEAIPLDDDSVDLIVGRSVIEHLPDNRAFLQNAFRVLRPGGRLIVCFSNRYAPFALINQLLPSRVAAGLLHSLVSNSAGYLGFPAHYDRCYPRAYEQALTAVGFDVEEHYHSYFGSYPFRFFVPIWMLSISVDFARYHLAPRNACSHNFYLLKKQKA
nr:methyltransferase domain-containing protein [Thiohalocapsa halophila]